MNMSIEFIFILSYRERKELSNGIKTFVIWITQTSENIEKVRAYQSDALTQLFDVQPSVLKLFSKNHSSLIIYF